MTAINPSSHVPAGADADPGRVHLHNSLARVEQTFLPIDSTIGKYRIIEEIDRGGMAVVYKAMQLDLDRVVALKVMPANISISQRFLERFLSEAHAVAKLTHPNIVNIHEVAQESNIFYLAMDYIPGMNLFHYLHRQKPKLVEVLEIVVRLADALAYAHDQKIIHRDLKLNNVIMNDKHSPVLIDFGLAKALEADPSSSITRTGEIVGSPAYMAPERLTGDPSDHRSDICSLGIMLYEMLTFKNPYLDQRSLHQTSINVLEANPIPPRKLVPWLPSEVEAITLKAMHGDPAKRYQSMEEFRADIVRYQKGERVLAQPPSLGSRLKYFFRRYWPYITIAGLVTVFVMVFAASFYIQSEKGKSHWQPVFSEKFGGREIGPAWWSPHATAEFDSAGPDSVRWRLHDGALVSRGGAFTYVRYEHGFTRDLLIEFDVEAEAHDFFDAGAFIYGNTPDSGYAFHVHHGGSSRSGMMFPGSGLLLSDYGLMQFPAQRKYHVEIEKRNSALLLRLNGTLVARRVDLFPPLGVKNQKLGFFSSGGPCRFDNLRIFQLAIPLSPSPTIIADRFWERGDFQAALEEYRGLRVDFSDPEITREVAIRIPDCLIRLGRFDEALEALRLIPVSNVREDNFSARALFLQAVAHERRGSDGPADSLFALLAQRFPASTANFSAARLLVDRAAARLGGLAPEAADELLSGLALRYPRHLHDIGTLHLAVLGQSVRRGSLEKSLLLGRRMEELYARDETVLALTKVALARVYLVKRQKQAAIDVLNQCIATHVASEGVWEAWLLLADIYEYEGNTTDALTIYRKVYRECPSGALYPWLARISMGEIAWKTSATEESPNAIFEDVIGAPHPFPLPRLIAGFYLWNLTERQFLDQWNALRPADSWYLYYFAKRAMFEGESVVARLYLQKLKDMTAPASWEYIRLYQMLIGLGQH